MKMAPIIKELEKYGNSICVVHTEQHYDSSMSGNILKDLELKDPDYRLGVMSGTHAEQTAKIMIEFEKICIQLVPKLVIVAGDVNSTVACAIVASKLHIKVAHVESGLRSFDKRMPEEINRILTDHISDLLFTTERSADFNLKNEGIDKSKIHFVGNCMIDSLVYYISRARKLKPWEKYVSSNDKYVLVTLHRPSNVDRKSDLANIINFLKEISKSHTVIFPSHPRTLNKIMEFDFSLKDSIKLTEPLPYLEFLGLLSESAFVLTDSGGVQEETTFLKIPCITLRENTERPITVEKGTNILAGINFDNISKDIRDIINGKIKKSEIPDLWDGKAASRIVKVINDFINV